MYIIPPTAKEIQDRRNLDIEVASAVFAAAGALLFTHAMGKLTYDPILALLAEWMGTALFFVSGWEIFKLAIGKNYFSSLTPNMDTRKVDELMRATEYGRFYLEEVRAQGREYCFGEICLAKHWLKKEKRGQYFKWLHFR